jgi:uncharacterized phage-like protein YoqJ
MKVVCGSGHRPNKLGGYEKASQRVVYKIALYALLDANPDFVISGMALGWDQALAYAAIHLDIPFVAALPFEGMESKWVESSRRFHDRLCNQAHKVKVISKGEYSAEKMQRRNVWMADRAGLALILWDGSSGGTGNFVKYAEEKDLVMRNYWSKFEELRFK